MFRYLTSLGLLLSLTCAVSAQAKRAPAVVVLRNTEPARAGADIYHDQAVLLDSAGNELTVISDLGVGHSLSHQNKVLIDAAHDRVLFVENLRDRLSAFDGNGNRQLTIPIESPSAIILTDDAKQIGCVGVGQTIDDLQTVFFDGTTGKEIRRLNWGGVAVINDVVGSQFWAVGRQLIAFTPDGEIRVRRPLSRLPAEPDHPTVVNSRNWCGIGVAIVPNRNAWMRSIWVIERHHPDVRGSRNRLFSVDPKGQTRILVELHDIDPISVTCASDRNGSLQYILVVDIATGNVVQFNVDGEMMRRKAFDVQLVAFGQESGLWVAGRKSVIQLDPSDLKVVGGHVFDREADAVGLSVR